MMFIRLADACSQMARITCDCGLLVSPRVVRHGHDARAVCQVASHDVAPEHTGRSVWQKSGHSGFLALHIRPSSPAHVRHDVHVSRLESASLPGRWPAPEIPQPATSIAVAIIPQHRCRTHQNRDDNCLRVRHSASYGVRKCYRHDCATKGFGSDPS